VLEAVKRGDRSSVIAFEWHLAELDALDRVEEP
jgi:hypothetical protein